MGCPELGNAGRNRPGLGGAGRNRPGLGGAGRSRLELGGAGRSRLELGGAERDCPELGDAGKDCPVCGGDGRGCPVFGGDGSFASCAWGAAAQGAASTVEVALRAAGSAGTMGRVGACRDGEHISPLSTTVGVVPHGYE